MFFPEDFEDEEGNPLTNDRAPSSDETAPRGPAVKRHYTSAEYELVRLSRYVQEHFARETPTEEPVVDCAIRLLAELRLTRAVVEAARTLHGACQADLLNRNDNAPIGSFRPLVKMLGEALAAHAAHSQHRSEP